MKLYAISDLHIDFTSNREALAQIPFFHEDWLIIAGDICSTLELFDYALRLLCHRFAKIIWVPGNHELWTMHGEDGIKGEEKYHHLVSLCRQHNVVTPEDPYPLWHGDGGMHYLVPLFLLYDYSFRPEGISIEEALKRAERSRTVCTDEVLLSSFPYSSKQEWCRKRCHYSEKRLLSLEYDIPLILVNHFPLREDLVRIFRIPDFSIWCGTNYTNDWHTRFNISTVVSGHLHVRSTDYLDGVIYEEVSLGYPSNWNQRKGIKNYLRQILPNAQSQHFEHHQGTLWHY